MTGQIAPAGTPVSSPVSSIGVERALPKVNARAPSAPPIDVNRPLDGKASPPHASAAVAQDQVEHSRAALERFARAMRRELEFAIDEASGNTIITVRNKETGEVVRQIPAEEVLALARALAEGRPALLDSKA